MQIPRLMHQFRSWSARWLSPRFVWPETRHEQHTRCRYPLAPPLFTPAQRRVVDELLTVTPAVEVGLPSTGASRLVSLAYVVGDGTVTDLDHPTTTEPPPSPRCPICGAPPDRTNYHELDYGNGYLERMVASYECPNAGNQQHLEARERGA